jgi:hypothetical protein
VYFAAGNEFQPLLPMRLTRRDGWPGAIRDN